MSPKYNHCCNTHITAFFVIRRPLYVLHLSSSSYFDPSEPNFLLLVYSFFSNFSYFSRSVLPLLSPSFIPLVTFPILLIIFIFFFTFISTCLFLRYTFYSSSSFLPIHKHFIQALKTSQRAKWCSAVDTPLAHTNTHTHTHTHTHIYTHTPTHTHTHTHTTHTPHTHTLHTHTHTTHTHTHQ